MARLSNAWCQASLRPWARFRVTTFSEVTSYAIPLVQSGNRIPPAAEGLRILLFSPLRAVEWLVIGAVAHSNVAPPMR